MDSYRLHGMLRDGNLQDIVWSSNLVEQVSVLLNPPLLQKIPANIAFSSCQFGEGTLRSLLILLLRQPELSYLDFTRQYLSLNEIEVLSQVFAHFSVAGKLKGLRFWLDLCDLPQADVPRAFQSLSKVPVHNLSLVYLDKKPTNLSLSLLLQGLGQDWDPSACSSVELRMRVNSQKEMNIIADTNFQGNGVSHLRLGAAYDVDDCFFLLASQS